ncbi:MAG: hypothetical protein CM15mP51_09130 [Porticoccaceae bacterium]|nr:MAG: hypothetical protein CM15mP51_09130 [Porticoccaceae bacterium]
MKTFLSNFFKLAENNTDVNRELMAGLTTFITMAYIIFVNPQLMASSGMDQGASFVGYLFSCCSGVPSYGDFC